MSFDGYGGERRSTLLLSVPDATTALACLPLPPISSDVYRLWEVMEMEFIPIQQILMDSKDRMQMKSQRRLRWLCPDVYFEWFLILTDFSLLYAESETICNRRLPCVVAVIVISILYNAF